MGLELAAVLLVLVYGAVMADCLVKGRPLVFAGLAAFAVYALTSSPYISFPGA